MYVPLSHTFSFSTPESNWMTVWLPRVQKKVMMNVRVSCSIPGYFFLVSNWKSLLRVHSNELILMLHVLDSLWNDIYPIWPEHPSSTQSSLTHNSIFSLSLSPSSLFSFPLQFWAGMKVKRHQTCITNIFISTGFCHHHFTGWGVQRRKTSPVSLLHHPILSLSLLCHLSCLFLLTEQFLSFSSLLLYFSSLSNR